MSTSIILIGGPTASGKSAYALELAQQVGGEIINADSMQLYAHLHILTARPTETHDVPHHLYGILQGNETSSVAEWYQKACEIIEDIRRRGKTPIVVGGTGLYLRALTHGLSPIPEIPDNIRQDVRHLATTLSKEDFFTQVVREDPQIQGILHPNDTQRLTRALEVKRATRCSIRDLQGKAQKILDLDYDYFVILPAREILYQRIDNRFVDMIKNGAIQEVKDLLAQNIDPHSPILKAVGVPELAAYLKGEVSSDQAIALGQQSTRNYAKRQITWFTHQVPEATMIP